MKQITTTKLNLIIVRSNLRQISPKDLTLEEVDLVVGKILPALSTVLKPDLQRYDEAEESMKALRKRLVDESIDQKEAQKESNRINDPILTWETSEEGGRTPVTVELEDSEARGFRELFEKHGSKWFGNIEYFYEFSKALR